MLEMGRERKAGAELMLAPENVTLWRLEIAALFKPNIGRRSQIASPR